MDFIINFLAFKDLGEFLIWIISVIKEHWLDFIIFEVMVIFFYYYIQGGTCKQVIIHQND
jgi:hypothetical protein